MTGTVLTKKDRPHYFIVLSYTDSEGKRQRPWITTDIPVKGNNKRLAKERLKEVLAEYSLKIVKKPPTGLFADFIEKWLENLFCSKSITVTTYDTYKILLDKHIVPYFRSLNLELEDIEPDHIQQYVNHKMTYLSQNTVKKHLSNISKCLDSAVRQNIILYNPAKRIETIKKVKYTGAKCYNERLIEELLRCSKGDPLETVVLLTVFYGFRRSEVLGLKWDAVNFENDTIDIKHTVVRVSKETHMKDSTKNESSCTTVPLSRIIKEHLIRWRAEQERHKSLQPNDYIDNGYICTKFNGELLGTTFVSQHFKLLLSKNDLPHIRFHDLRHSSASYLKHLGFDLKDIQIWLRHGDIQTSMNLYTHLDMDAKRGIADSIDRRFTEFKSV